jgi:hypothetical protein
MERGLLQNDFEDGVAVGDVHESVDAEHETQQAATPTVVGDAGHAGLGEVGAAEDNAANPAAAEVHEEQIVVVVHGHNARPAHRPDDGDRIRLAPTLCAGAEDERQPRKGKGSDADAPSHEGHISAW